MFTEPTRERRGPRLVLATLAIVLAACKQTAAGDAKVDAAPTMPPSSTVDSAEDARVEKAVALLRQALALTKSKDYVEARKILDSIVADNPGTDEGDQAKAQLAKLDQLERAAEDAKTAPETIKKMKATRAFEDAEGTKIGIVNVSVTRKWFFGNFGMGNYSKDADKDAAYVVVEFDATTKAKEPNLPCVHAFLRAPDGLTFTRLATPLAIEFRRWDSYASALGTNSDTGNDFAKSETVKFAAGAEVLLTTLATKQLYIGFTKQPRVQRAEEANDPPAYKTALCTKGAQEVSAGDLLREYEIAEIRAARAY